MPPRRRVSAPVERVYKSATPLRQTKLGGQKKLIKYGKQTRPRIPKKDNTLTQMEFIHIERPVEEKEDPIEEDLEVYEEASEKRRKRRRKTMGDEPSATPSYNTQTITQLDWSFSTAPKEPPENEEEDIYDGPSSSHAAIPAQRGKSSTLTKRRNPLRATQIPLKQIVENPLVGEEDIFDGSYSSIIKPIQKPKALKSKKHKKPPVSQSSVRDMPPPPTPNRPITREIPSSQSPATPLTIRSPLRRIPINTTPIPFNARGERKSSPPKLPKLEIEDTFDTATEISQLSRFSFTPTKKSSPAKSVRFALPGESGEETIVSPLFERDSHGPQASQVLGSDDLIEIQDSDAEDEESEAETRTALQNGDNKGVEEESQAEPETCYGEIGSETLLAADQLVEEAEPVEEALNSMDGGITEHPNSDAWTQGRTQFTESQRLSTQQVHAMAPRTTESDVFVSVHPQQVAEFLDRSRDHLTRAWEIPKHVSRLWIYETQPSSTLKYMAVIGPARRPGEIVNENGKGNAEFNKKIGGNWYAYEIIELYELAGPLPLAQLISNEWLHRAPGKYNRVAPAAIDQMIANLMHPLFDPLAEEASPPSSSTDTQEAEAQLRSTIQQFTQPVVLPSSPMPSSPPIKFESESLPQLAHDETVPKELKIEDSDIEEVYVDATAIEEQESDELLQEEHMETDIEERQENIPASPQRPTLPYTSQGLPPSQATTVDLSQFQTPRHSSVSEIVFESPRPLPFSTPLKLPSPRKSGGNKYGAPETLVPFSMASSQLLTKSQMLQDSLIENGMSLGTDLGMEVMDSDEDEDDE